MRRAAVPLTVVASFALITPAIGLPDFSASQFKTSSISGAAERQIQQISRTVPAAPPRALRQTGLLVPGAGPRPSRAAMSVPVATPAPLRAYTVQSGDSLWNISRQYGVSVEQLASANGLALTSTLKLGQELVIPSGAPAPARAVARTATPPGSTVVHVVSSGETLWDIAKRYGTRVEDVMALNDLGDSEWIKPGQRLIISGRAVPRYRQIAQQQSRSRQGQSRVDAAVMADASVLRAAGAFLWPARGLLTSRFGWRYRRQHGGIDLANPYGTPIYATRDGVVEFAGWNGGYGKVVYIDHGGGLVTVYGHASTLLVQPGQRVKKGQTIARVGCTGVCTGSHVHFEVRVNGRPVDPLPYLK